VRNRDWKWLSEHKWDILRLLVILFAIVFLFSWLSRMLTRNTTTLRDLASQSSESEGGKVADSMGGGELGDNDDSNYVGNNSNSGGTSGAVGNGDGRQNTQSNGNGNDENGLGNEGSSSKNGLGGGKEVNTSNSGLVEKDDQEISDDAGSDQTFLDTAAAVPVTGSNMVGALLNAEWMVDNRETVYEGFYYEPLSENLQRFITGISYPVGGADEIDYDDLRYLHILTYDFNGNVAEGELICNISIAADLAEIFYELYRHEYQLDKVHLIDIYNGGDDAAVADNNTSCFNYRQVEGSSNLSKHALGLAVDINPYYNPYVTYGSDGSVHISPEGAEQYADRSKPFPYKIDENDLCYKLFTDHGFIWGGNWNSLKDYQHFQKILD
jgi:hypothetical protein